MEPVNTTTPPVSPDAGASVINNMPDKKPGIRDYAKKFLTKKVLIGVIVVLFLAEGMWTIKTLSTSLQSKPAAGPAGTDVSIEGLDASLSLQSSKSEVSKGEKFTVSIDIASQYPTDGTDIIISYDPVYLSVITDAKTNSPVTVGAVYSDYPVNSVDEKAGKIVISGITSKAGGIIPQGNFGQVTFQARSAGKTQVKFDFTPGKTTDSNVIEAKTAKDLLGRVDDLEVNIK